MCKTVLLTILLMPFLVGQSALKSKPKAKIEFLDQLLVKREKGELRAYVEDIATNKCKGGKK